MSNSSSSSKRRLVITAVLAGSSQSEVARTYGVSQGWISRLMKLYEAEGEGAFEPRSRAPRNSPTATPPATVELVLRLRKELSEAGLDPLFDDRKANAGEKLTDAELIGCPVRIVVGKRTLAEGQVEAQVRATGEDSRIDVANVAAEAAALLDAAN